MEFTYQRIGCASLVYDQLHGQHYEHYFTAYAKKMCGRDKIRESKPGGMTVYKHPSTESVTCSV